MLVSINRDYYALKLENNLLWGDASAALAFNQELDRKLWMILGEACVFVLILAYGVVRMRMAYKAESDANKQQQNFLSAVTHELKSPIASLKLQLQTAKREGIEQKQQEELLNKAISDSERLNVLVDNILLASQIQEGAFSLHKSSGNLSEYIKRAISNYSSIAQSTHKISSNIVAGLTFNFDPNAFDSILSNLIENAIKYSQEGTEINIELKEVGSAVVLTIEDQGIGVQPENRLKIFDRFFREADEQVRKTKGTGLGLYIVNELVKQHGGTISVDSQSGKGSIFTVRFSRHN